MTYIICFMLGMFAGSMLYIIIDRLPQGQKIFANILCSHCHSRVRLYDLIPILGHLISDWRCRHCGQLFSLRKPIIELFTSLLFFLCYATLGSSIHLLKALIFTSFLIVISFIDYDHSLILDNVLIPMAVIGVTINLLIGEVKTLNMLSSALVGGGVFLLLAIISQGGFGGGDIKFMACLGLWLGIKSTFITLLFSFILGGIGAAMLILLKRKTVKDKFPYGPYIAAASFITMLYGDAILNWYLHLFSQYR